MKTRCDIPPDRLAEAKRIAGLASDDPDAASSYPLSRRRRERLPGSLTRRSILPLWNSFLNRSQNSIADDGPRSYAYLFSRTHRPSSLCNRPSLRRRTILNSSSPSFPRCFPAVKRMTHRRDAGYPQAGEVDPRRGRRWRSMVGRPPLHRSGGVPTLVEVKRQSDTRLRREVVGQMLDYAANTVVYSQLDQLREDFEEACTKNGTDPEEEIRNHLGAEDMERLWRSVKTNLLAGHIAALRRPRSRLSCGASSSS